MSWVPTELDSPFKRIGGREATLALAEAFYDAMEANEPALAKLHPLDEQGRITRTARDRFALFLVAATAAAGVLGVFVGGGAGLAPALLALIFAWMLEGPSQSLLFFGVFPMTRLAFAALALILVVFSELEATRSLLRLLFVLGGLPVAWLFARGLGGGRGGGPRFPRVRNPFRRRRFTVVGSDTVH